MKEALGLNFKENKNFVHSGRPLKFTPEQFEERVMAYFQWCEDEKKPMTLERLACFLNCDADTILNYSHRDEFFGAIKKLRAYILANKVEMLLSGKGSTIGYIFDLKNNHHWTDMQEVKVTTELIPITLAEDKEIIDITPKKKEVVDQSD